MDKLDLICKFVYLGDKEIGETIDVYGGKLIVKMGAKFAAIPLKNVERVDEEGVYISGYDEKEAMDDGKIWEEEKSKPVSIEELKIFGFGEDNKNRFSIILKEIGEYEEGEGQKDTDTEKETNQKDSDEKEQSKIEAKSSKIEQIEANKEEEEKDKEVRDLGEGIIDRL